MISRREFLRQSSLVAAGSTWLNFSCRPSAQKLSGTLGGPNASLGHKIRDGLQLPVAETLREDIVIVGGGVAGLSAARLLHRAGKSFTLLELEPETGGNSRAASNHLTAYPLGAHYLPVPGPENHDLIEFLQECRVITGFENRLPVYDDHYLCFDPKERLYLNQHWQEGLIPHEGVPLADRQEIERFLALMDGYRHKLGRDGKKAFAIPVDDSSQDAEFLKLDRISMADYLDQSGFVSPFLVWYVEYCCHDDYGSSLNDTSAWAGIHYFASRNGTAANAKSDDVLTWPEGNAWLTRKLREGFENQLHTRAAVISVRLVKGNAQVDFYDGTTHELKRVEAGAVIMCTPQFMNKHLLANTRQIDYSAFQYAPWMVANLTVNASLQEKRGEPLSWDNVIYGSTSLGYVFAQHQALEISQSERVITYYQPITGASCNSLRLQAQQKTWHQWTQEVFTDLQKAHPDISSATTNMDVYLWGHGMIRPHPGFVWGAQRKRASQPIDNKIFFAHSDLSGISVFEESFSHGLNAARQLLHTT